MSSYEYYEMEYEREFFSDEEWTSEDEAQAEAFAAANISEQQAEQPRENAALHDRPVISNTTTGGYWLSSFTGNWSLYQQPTDAQATTSKPGDNMDAFVNSLKKLPESETAGQDCAICLLPYDKKNEEHGAAVCMPCHRGHSGHEECIRTWLEQNPSCPHCRKEFPECQVGYTLYEYVETGFQARS